MHCLVICLPYKSSSLAGSWFPNNSMNTWRAPARARMKLWRNWQIGVGNSSFSSVAWEYSEAVGSAWTWCMMTRLNIVFMVIFDPRKLKNLMTSHHCSVRRMGFNGKSLTSCNFNQENWGEEEISREKKLGKRSAAVGCALLMKVGHLWFSGFSVFCNN